MKNRVIKVLLTMAMVVGLMPGMPVYADEDPAYAQYKNTTTVIKFDEKDWYLINYDTSTVTLLAKECVALSKYNQNSNDHNGYIYEGSTVEDTVNTYYTNSISADAKTAVSGGRMFLLTTEQASATTTDVRKTPAYTEYGFNRWWLCSLGSAGFNVAYVSCTDGTVSENGDNVTCQYGVRPALKLDLSKVTFDSESKTFSLKPHTHDEIVWTSTNSLPTTTGSYYLTENVTLTSNWQIPEGVTIDLCLNGHNIVYNNAYYPVISVKSGAKLNLYDCSDNPGKISNNASTGVSVYGTFTMNGGVITGCKGSGVIINDGSFTMNGGSITGNTCTGFGAGVNIGYGKSFVMNGGSITNNSAGKRGGGVYFYEGSFTMNGGTITGNSAKELGGGVYVDGSFTVKGDINITNNKSGNDDHTDNVYLYKSGSNYKIVFSDALSEGSKIGVTLGSNYSSAVFTSGYKTYHGTTDPKTVFTDDAANSNYGFYIRSNGEVARLRHYTVAISSTEHGTVTADKNASPASEYVKLTVTPEDGYHVSSLIYKYTNYYGEVTEEVVNNQIYMPPYNITVYATFVSHEHNFTYSADGATITAECTAADCDLPLVDGKHIATLTIAAPLHTTYGDGKDAAAQITDVNAIQGDAKVVYQKKNDESYGQATETAPTDAGDYKASITLGSGNNTATASVEYTIEKADPNPSSNLTGSAKYGQKHQDISLNMPFDSTPGVWSWVEPDASVGSIGEHTFNINFTPTDAANYKSLSNVPVTVTVGKADNPATVTATASVKKGGVELDLAGNVSLNGATGAVEYGFPYPSQKIGCELNGSILTSGTTTGSVYVVAEVAADDNYNASDQFWITVTITDKDIQTITAQDVTVTYGDTDKSVSATVTVPETGGGAISYAVKSGSEEYIGIDSSTGVLTIKKVPADGKAYVTVTAAETETYAETTKEVIVTISKATPLANNFTYTAPSDLVYDGTAKSATVVKADGVTGMGTVTVKYYSDASCSTEAEPINAVTYYVGITVAQGDNYNATASVLHGDSWTFTIGKADPTPATITANNRTYDGTDKPLVTVSGKPTGGTMEYGISSTEDAPGIYTGNIPTATYAGTYYVWYKVIGDDNHNNTEPKKLTVTVAKADSAVKTAPAANDLTYTGDPQPLISAGTAEGGTMKYSTDGTNYSAAIPAGTNAGPYTVYYMVEGDEDHNDTDPQTLEVNIKKADPTPLLPEGFVVNAEPGDTLAANESQLPEGWAWVDGTTGVGNDDGTFTFPANYTGSSNYDPDKQVQITVVVSNAYYDYVSGSSSGVWTKGSAGTLSFTFKRSQKDKQKTFDSFLSASCDGNPMTKDDQYTIKQGSLKIYLNDSMLNKLSVGTHTLLVAFSDGEAATTFRVIEKSSGGGDSSRDYNPPKTGIE